MSVPAAASPGAADLNFGPTRRIRRDARRAEKKNEHPHARVPWELRVLFTLIALAVLAQVGWIISGGSLYRINSPSMCPQVCVGALVIDRPLAAGATLHKGETVTFIPPGFSVPYTHRVVKVFANGTFQTKADAANIVDPWLVSPSELKGVTVATVWGLGWLSSALPFLAAGMSVILLLRRSFDVRIRRAFDRLMVVIMVVVPVWLLKPLIRAMVVQTTSLKNNVERLTIVNTGLLPSQFRASEGQFKDFVASGQRITLTGRIGTNGQVAVKQFVSFHWLGWTIVALVIASPLLIFLIQLPKQRRLAVQYLGPSLAERLAKEYPEEVLAAAFARVRGVAGAPEVPRATSMPTSSPPRALNDDVNVLAGESSFQPANVPEHVPSREVEKANEPTKPKKNKKNKKKKNKKKKKKDATKNTVEGPW
ncbi:MAG: S26 family signal peptidase [Acidimicrobiales bacterium]